MQQGHAPIHSGSSVSPAFIDLRAAALTFPPCLTPRKSASLPGSSSFIAVSSPEAGWLLGCGRELDLVATAGDALSVSAVGDDLGDALTAVVRLGAALDALREAGAFSVDDIFKASSVQEGRMHAIISSQVRSCNTRTQLPS